MERKTALIMSLICAAFTAGAVFLRPSGPWTAMLALCAAVSFPPVYILAKRLGISHGTWQHFLFSAVVLLCALIFFFFRNGIISHIYKAQGEAASDTYARHEVTEYDEDTTAGNEKVSECVYITKTGTKYHTSPECAGSSATQTTLAKAVEQGYVPCKKCAAD
ncbi:MAG: hypothetical protein ACI3YE_06160 [Candidatus Avispirillum sp.]